MKRTFRCILAAAMFFCTALYAPAKGGGHSSGSKSSGAPVHVNGYTRKDGTYVAPHYRSAPNGTKDDNWSTKGNVNPYTGKPGTKPGDSSETSPGAQSADPNPASPQVSSSTNKSPPPNFSLLKVGMTKAHVVVALGEPNIKTESIWLYSGAGKVRFKDGQLAGVDKAEVGPPAGK